MKKKLKILKIDKYYFIKGGAERYYFELKKILESYGHEIIPFSMQHSENFQTEYEQYFVDNIEFNQASAIKKLINAPKILERIVYSFHAKSRLEKLINKVKPDIAHLHMIDHQLSPSILHTLKKHNIPVIQTVHQYKIACPNYKFYNPTKGQICEKCVNGNFLHPIIERCHKNSIFASSLLTLEAYVHKMLNIYNNIDLFHVPSAFMGKKLIESGINEDKVFKLYYTINLDDYPYHPQYDDYFIYYGRLSHEKGILTLLKAAANFPKSKLLIIGDGPQRNELEKFAAKNDLKHVQFLGNKSKDELKSLVSRSKFVVVPSEWYDNSPLVIYESFSMGKPVIGAKLGGIAELVDHDCNGLHFEAGNVSELCDKISYLSDNPNLIDQFSKEARLKAEREFSPQPHYEKMLALYNDLISKI